MDFPHDVAATTPDRALAGPSRVRKDARQQRSMLSKPYGRPSTGASPAALSSSVGRSSMQRPQVHSRLSIESSSPASLRPKQRDVGDGSPQQQQRGGILSGLRDAIFSRPLSWLQRGAPQSETLPTPASPEARKTPSVLTAEQRNAAQRLSSSASTSSGRVVPSLGLATPYSTQTPSSSSSPRVPFAHPNAGRPSRSTPSNQAAYQLNGQPRSPSPARSSASAAVAAHGRQRLSVEPNSPFVLGSSSSTMGTPGYRRSGSRQAPGAGAPGSTSGLSAAQSSASFAYGFGSERRLGGIGRPSSGGQPPASPSPLVASISYGRLPSRSPFAIQRTSGRLSTSGTSEMGLLDKSPSRPATVYGGEQNRSRAGSVAHSRTSSQAITPRRREWSSLKLAPPTARQSEGERLMQEYVAMRNTASGELAGDSLPPALNEHDFASSPMDTDFGPVLDTDTRSQGGSLKRDASMSIDGDTHLGESVPRKRQMVWDQQMGFISRQELRAAQPARPVAHNEAERLLNALEGMRTPLGDARREASARSATPSRRMANVSVPLHVSTRPDVDMDTASLGHYGKAFTKAVSPYSRALRQTRLSQSAEPEAEGMRSRLRRSVKTAPMSVQGSRSKRGQHQRESDAMSIGSGDGEGSRDGSEIGGIDLDEHAEKEHRDDEYVDDDDVVEPPRRRVERTKQSNQRAQNNQQQSHQQTPSAEGRTLRSGKVLPPSPPKPHTPPSPHKDPAKPMSRARIGISANGASAANRERAERQAAAPVPSHETAKDKFMVRDDFNGGSSRSRSSLRQGVEKTSRSHAKSGRIGLDDDGEDGDETDDGPSTDELNKIKLPTNLFPQGFAFAPSATSSASSRAESKATSPAPLQTSFEPAPSGTKALPAPGDDENGDSEPSSTAPSLLSRMGGFAASTAGKDSEQKSTPAFSFGSAASAPSSALEPVAPMGNKPLFSFQPAKPSPLSTVSSAGARASPTSSAASATSPGFFAAPPKSSSSEESKSIDAAPKKDGPVPNFFASSLAKANNNVQSNAPASSASTTSAPSFNLGLPASSAANSQANKLADASSGYAFGQPAKADAPTSKSFSFGSLDNKDTNKTGSMSGANLSFSANSKEREAKASDANNVSFSFGGAGKVDGTTAESNKGSATAISSGPSFSFGSAPSSTASPTFEGFGTTASASTESTSKPAFSFGAPQQSNGPAMPAFGGGFGQASTNADNKKRGNDENSDERSNEGPRKKGASFGGGAPSFSFGAPAGAKSPSGGLSFGSSDNSTETSKPAFSFGTSKAASPSQAVPSFGGFGSSSDPSTSAPASAKPSVSFGTPSITSAPTATSSTAASGTSQPAEGFQFGTPASSAPQTGGFSFGAPSSSSASSPFGQAAPPQPTQSGMFGVSNAAIGASSSNPFGGANSTNERATSTPLSAFGSQDNSRQNSPAPFTFGAPSPAQQQPQQPASEVASSGFGGFGQQGRPSSGASTPTFTFGAASAQPAPPPSSGGAGFSFAMPMGAGGGSASGGGFGSGAQNQGAAMGGGAAQPASPAPFVFGGGGGGSALNGTASPAPSGAGGGGGFSFGTPSGGSSPAPQGPPAGGGGGGGNLFNIGGPSASSPAGNRVVRGMPSRRRKP